ncbi:Flp pilus assembly protein CpaB [Nitriliruptoraceae bacterium ZYF776]|nr:Flp pilus assembly protein CpaB [Profundirhabdus halotolerans]
MNPRQRRGALLIFLAAIGVVAVVVMVANYVGAVRAEVGPVAQAVVLTSQVEANGTITEDMLGTVEVPERWMTETLLTEPAAAVGLVTPVTLPAGAMLQDGMLEAPPEIAPGEREIAIMVDAETGVAGRIGPGSIVDIIATFSGDQEVPNQSYYMIQNARIVEVGIPMTEAQEAEAGGFQQSEVVPVTFALTDAESLRLAYIESFATRVRLVIKSPLDDEILEDDDRGYQPNLSQIAEAELGQPSSPPPGEATDEGDAEDDADGGDEG